MAGHQTIWVIYYNITIDKGLETCGEVK